MDTVFRALVDTRTCSRLWEGRVPRASVPVALADTASTAMMNLEIAMVGILARMLGAVS